MGSNPATPTINIIVSIGLSDCLRIRAFGKKRNEKARNSPKRIRSPAKNPATFSDPFPLQATRGPLTEPIAWIGLSGDVALPHSAANLLSLATDRACVFDGIDGLSLAFKIEFSHGSGHLSGTKECAFSQKGKGDARRRAPKRVPFISNENENSLRPEKTGDGETDWRGHCKTLSAMKLRTLYPREANTHRNMLSRQKSRGAVVSPEFLEFRSFLWHVGPVPAKGATLDRVDNSDPEYAPGKVRWADKRTQNSNKGDSLLFQCSRTLKCYASSQLARAQKVSASTIRKRRLRGWTDDEVIQGKRVTEPLGARHRACRHDYAQPVLEQPTVPPHRNRPSQLTAAQVEYERMAEDFRAAHELYGKDPLPATQDELNDLLQPSVKITAEDYERQFRRLWPAYRPHIKFFERAHPEHQRLIEKIDPDWVARLREARARLAELEDLL